MGLFGAKPAPKPLRLIAQSPDDLPALAALIQDAALRSGDLAYEPAGRHFTVRMNRFCHEAPGRTPLRAPSVLRLSCVTRVQSRGLDMARKDIALSILDLAIQPSANPDEDPSCTLILRFAGPGERDLRIDAECVDLLLMDLAAPRRAKSTPSHGL